MSKATQTNFCSSARRTGVVKTPQGDSISADYKEIFKEIFTVLSRAKADGPACLPSDNKPLQQQRNHNLETTR